VSTAKFISARHVMSVLDLPRSSAYDVMRKLGAVHVFGRSLRLRKDKLDDYIRAMQPAEEPKPSMVPPESPGVYALEGAPGWIKIGKAKNIAGRIKELQCGHPVPLRLLAVLSTKQRDEGAFHKR
jgi:hypothetical protein